MSVVILCIAHEGLSQGALWSRWLSGASRPLHMRVFCPRDAVLPEGAKRLPIWFATSWASPQLVYVLQECYKSILAEFDNLKMIYLISGKDIPVCSPETLLELPSTSRIAFTRSGNGLHQNRKDKILEVRTKQLKSYGLTAQPCHSATQWIHLTKEHARLIAEFPLWRMQLLHSKLVHTYQHYGKNMPVADEYWPWTILLQCGVTARDVIDEISTQQDRSEPYDASPIEWTSLDQKQKTFRCYEDSLARHDDSSLADILKGLVGSGTLFYRKVSSAVDSYEIENLLFDKL
jgi:hypothetical protein